MNKIIKKIMLLIFVGILILIPIIYYTIKTINGKDSELMKAIDFDLNEKRAYAEFEYDNIIDFPKDFERFFNDHIPFRSYLIQNKRNIESVVEKPYIGGFEEFLMGIGKKKVSKKRNYAVYSQKYMDYPVRQFTNHALMPWEYDEVDDSEYPVKTSGKVVFGKKNWLFFYDNNMPYYKGENVLKDDEYEKYLESYEALDKLCKQKGKKIYYLVIPEKEHIYSEYMPTMERVDTVGKIKRIRDYVSTASDITFIFPYEELMDKKKFYRLYKKYDSHYNNAGAYVVYNTIKEKEGKDIINIDDCKIDKMEMREKDLVWLAGQSEENYMDDYEYYVYYKEDSDLKLDYADYNKESGDVNTWIETYSCNVDNDDKVFFYGDSFKEMIKKYLIKDYKQTTLIGTQSPKKKAALKKAVEESNIIIVEIGERNEEALLPYMMVDLTKELSKLKDVKNDNVINETIEETIEAKKTKKKSK